MTMHDIHSFLLRKGERLNSASPAEIKSIESFYNIVLPKVYKDFLSLMGKGAGNYLKGSSVFFRDIFKLKEWTLDLIVENELPSLPPTAFPFWMHQGYQVAYFNTNEGEDPPVYYYTEDYDHKNFTLGAKSLTAFFVIELKQSYPNEKIII